MTEATQKFFKRTFWALFIPAVMLWVMTPWQTAWAAFGEDLEKPKPEFSRDGGKITAKLIPRAKSTSVLIHFEVAGGHLVDVEGMDFEEASHPDVDNKDFKSELFVVNINGIKPGSQVQVSVTSDFFSGSTQFWVYNPNAKTPWINAEAQNISHPDLIQELVIGVKDGGSFDSDGLANGRIVFKGGPKDSFWGYALGTLFIRFFGIFLVLSILMIGMILCGKIFQMLDKKAAEAKDQVEARPPAIKAESGLAQDEQMVTPDLAAAVSLALHMHFSGLQPATQPARFFTPQLTPWARQGRERIMNARYISVNRKNRLQNR